MKSEYKFTENWFTLLALCVMGKFV